MALAVFNPLLDQGFTAFMGYTWRDDQAVKSWKRGAPGRFQAVALEDLSRRSWTWPAGLDETPAQRATWEAFLRARDFTREPFLLRDPKDAPRLAVPLEPSTGDGARTEFSLPTGSTDEESRWYALAGSVQLYVAGSPVATGSVDVDARTVTYAAPPGLGLAVTADYAPLRLVRLLAAPTMTGVDPDWTRYELALEEVLRDA